MSKGVAVGQVLEGDRQLRSTPEGETFRGFTEFLNDPAQQARSPGRHRGPRRDFIDELAHRAHTLANLVRELRRQAGEVHSSYGWRTESLHAYVQSDAFRESHAAAQGDPRRRAGGGQAPPR